MATNNSLVSWAESVLAKWSAKISKILGVPAIDITFAIGDMTTPTAAAEADGTTIKLNAKWFRDHPDDEGGVVHEIAHAFIQGPGGNVTGRGAEAIADYVRYKLGLTYAGWEPSERVLNLESAGPERVRELVQNLSANVSVNTTAGGTVETDRFAGFYHGQRGQGLTVEQIMDYWNRLGTQLEAQGLTLDTYLAQFGYTQDDVTEAGITTPTTTIEDLLAGLTAETGLTRADYVAQVIALGLKPSEVSSTIEAALAGGWDMNKFMNALRRDPDFQARFELGYEAQLSSLGIVVTPDIQQLLQEAVARGYTSAEFMYRLQQTQSFRDRFPGIFLPNGQLRMSVEQYLGYEQQYRLQSQRYGYRFNSQIMGGLVTKGITPELFSERLQAVQRVSENRVALNQFEAVLKRRGMLPAGGFAKGDVYNIVMGTANPLWYKVWEESSARTAAVNAGLSIGADLSARDIRQLVRRLPGQQTEESLAPGFERVAEGIRTVIPLSQARQFGVTREDILKAVFGGKGANLSRSQIERAVATAEALATGEVATGEFTPGGVGQQGRGGTAQ